jgi:hypothetical protein
LLSAIAYIVSLSLTRTWSDNSLYTLHSSPVGQLQEKSSFRWKKRLLIVTSQNHRLKLLVSLFEVKRLYRKMAASIIYKLKDSDLIGYKTVISLYQSVLKRSHEYQDFSASWLTGDEWRVIKTWSAVDLPHYRLILSKSELLYTIIFY